MRQPFISRAGIIFIPTTYHHNSWWLAHLLPVIHATFLTQYPFFDAQRFLLLFLMRDAQAIRDGMGDFISLYIDLVSKTYSKGKYAELKKGLLSAKSYIQQVAQIKADSKRWENRDSAFASCKPHIDALKEYIDVYETISDEFVRIRKDAEDAKLAVEASKRAEEVDRRRSFILAVLGLAVTIIVGVATICFAG